MTENAAQIPPLDERLYKLDDEERTFYQSQTGIADETALKSHIFAVQAKAYKVLKVSRQPAYGHLLKLGKERKGAIFLDIGCCFGNDIRKAVADGYPIENVIASDLRQEFWELGHELFKTTPETFPVPFIAGDAFDPNFISSTSPFYDPPSSPAPPLTSISTLTPLQGHISAIHASSFFHLFDEAQQLELARKLASLLSPEPGSIIFGSHRGSSVKGVQLMDRDFGRRERFCDSPESWRELWDGQIFRKGTVKVEAKLVEAERPDLGDGKKVTWLVWSVTRL